MKHFIIDLYNCGNLHKLGVQETIDSLKKFCAKIDHTIVGEAKYKFEPYGLTITLLLAESHIAVHTWPEHGYVALDLFTCRDDELKDHDLNHIYDFFQSRSHSIKTIDRFLNYSAEKM